MKWTFHELGICMYTKGKILSDMDCHEFRCGRTLPDPLGKCQRCGMHLKIVIRAISINHSFGIIENEIILIEF